jgi:acyl-CoA thioesterase-1
MYKKTGIVLLIIAACIAGIYYFFRTPTQDVANTHSQGQAIIAFGDSLTAGVGATEGNDYVTVLSQKLGVPVINLGVSGDTTKSALNRVSDVFTLNPKIVIILLGGNDAIQKVPKEETFSNLKTIIEAFQNNGSMTVLVGIQGGLFTDKYQSDFYDLAKETKSLYIPSILSGIIGKDDYMSDPIHPNDRGYAIIAERIYQALKPYIH